MRIGRFLRSASYYNLSAGRRAFGGADLQSEAWDCRGISILGTSGIVEPMSSQALLDTIKVELNQKKAEGYKIAAVSPGNYGLDYMKKTYDYDLDRSVKCSNFIGDTIDMAVDIGFEKCCSRDISENW